jgi:hypothetical protein
MLEANDFSRQAETRWRGTEEDERYLCDPILKSVRVVNDCRDVEFRDLNGHCGLKMDHRPATLAA